MISCIEIQETIWFQFLLSIKIAILNIDIYMQLIVDYGFDDNNSDLFLFNFPIEILFIIYVIQGFVFSL